MRKTDEKWFQTAHTTRDSDSNKNEDKMRFNCGLATFYSATPSITMTEKPGIVRGESKIKVDFIDIFDPATATRIYCTVPIHDKHVCFQRLLSKKSNEDCC